MSTWGGDGGRGPDGSRGPQFDQGVGGQQHWGQQYPQDGQGHPDQPYPQDGPGHPGQPYPQASPGPHAYQSAQYPDAQYRDDQYRDAQYRDTQYHASPYHENHWPGAAPARSGVLGMVGLGLVVAASVVVAVLAWMFGTSFGEFALQLASGSYMTEEEVLSDPRTQQWIQSAIGPIIGMLVACLLGLTGWIISIVATVQRRGRAFGIVGIILGALALPIAYATFMAGLLPVMEQLNI